MSHLNESLPSISEDVVVSRELAHKAFLSHEGTEKRTVVDLLRRALRGRGICDGKVFYDDYMKRGGNADEHLKNRLTDGLLASEYLIVFLTPDFLAKKWPMWELRMFLGMMEKDKRRKLLPVFYKVSAEQCGEIAKREVSEKIRSKFGLRENSDELRTVLRKVKAQVGIDAEGLRISDTDVVDRIMKDVFGIDVWDEGHDVVTCSKPLCDHPTCADSIRSSLDNFFAVPSLPTHTKLDFENGVRPEKILRDKLLSEASKAVAAYGVKGMGGAGKTTCLIGVANDRQVREAFPEGVLWIQLSTNTKAEDVRKIFVKILQYPWYCWKTQIKEVALNPRASWSDVVKSTAEALENKKCLIVLDDIWIFNKWSGSVQVERFGADGTKVEDLDDETASVLFDEWCEGAPGEEEEEEKNLKKETLELCSNLALAVCIAGSNVRRIAKSEGGRGALRRVVGDLKGNLSNLQKPDGFRDDQKLNAVMQTSTDSITDEGHKNGYRCLAVFANKTRIPNQALEALWRTDTANVAARVDLYMACSLATRKVMVESGSRSSYYVEFHDQHLAYAKYSCRCANETWGTEKRHRSWERDAILAKLHDQIVDGYEKLHSDVNARVWWEADYLSDGYFHENFISHLEKSGRVEELLKVVMDYRWIAIRCRRGEMTGLLGDLDLAISALEGYQMRKRLNWEPSGFGGPCVESNESSAGACTDAMRNNKGQALRLVREALVASQAALRESGDEVTFQLVGRLQTHSSENKLIKDLIDGALRWERRPWLRPISPCLESPMARCFQVHHASSSVSSVAVCCRARRLVACGTVDGHVHVWDWSTGGSLWTQKDHEDEVRSLALTEDGSVMVSGSGDKTARLWNVESRECKKVFLGHESGVDSVAVGEGGGVVVTASLHSVRLWNVRLSNVENGECTKLFHTDVFFICSVALTRDGDVLVVGGDDNRLLLWNVKGGVCEIMRDESRFSWPTAAIARGGSALAAADKGILALFHVESREWTRTFQDRSLYNSQVLAYDGSVAVSHSCHNTLRLWDLESGECKSVLRGHEDSVTASTVTEDGNVVVSGSRDDTVRLWHVKSGECKSVLQGHEFHVEAAAATEDGSIVVSGAFGHTLRVWDVESGECKFVFQGGCCYLEAVAVAEDGSVAVSSSHPDGAVRVWDLKSRECKVFEGHLDGVVSVAVTKDGGVVVSGSSDGTVRVWDVKSKECKSVLREHNVADDYYSDYDDDDEEIYLEHKPYSVLSVAVTDDGSVAVSGSDDNSVRLWDVKDRVCERVLRGHERPVISLALTENNCFVVSGSWDRTLRLWNMKNGESLKTVDCNLPFSYVSNMFQNRNFLRWVRTVGLLTRDGENDLGVADSCSLLPGGAGIRVERGAVKVMSAENGRTAMSATFDNTVLSALVVNLKGSPKVIVVGTLHVFILEIGNLDQLEREMSMIDAKDCRS